MEDNYEQWLKDEKAPFEGWNFSYLKGRIETGSPPWDYQKIAEEALQNAESVLEMATGGGEKFSELAPFPEQTIAIEGYAPNYPIAKNRLEPLGVKVLQMKASGKLDFDDSYFDLILNRHGGFDYSEIARVLKLGGRFITQQVPANNWDDLRKEFNAPIKWPDRMPDTVAKELNKNGFIIKRLETWEGNYIFKDVGALVFILKAVPWTVDNFSVDNFRSILERLRERIKKEGQLVFTDRKYLIIASK